MEGWNPGGTPPSDPPAQPDPDTVEVPDSGGLEHSQGGATTRDDTHDVGVPMLQGDPSEPQGPEDALGEGDKRGDYRDRIVGDPHTAVPLKVEGDGLVRDDDGNVVDRQPTSAVVPQAPRTEEIGDVPGKKGGVAT